MNSAELEKIMERHGDMVYRIALTHTLDRFLSEDIFQEVFLELVKNYPKIKSEEHLKHWLIRTAVNESFSVIKKRKRYGTAYSEDMSKTEDDTLISDLKMSLEGLPEKYRAVIYLCCFEGCTASEAGKILGRSAGTVKSQLHRARNLVKLSLEGNL